MKTKFYYILLAVILSGLTGCGQPIPRLVIKYSQTGEVLELKNLGPGHQPAWSPDGKKIAYVNHGDIWLMDPDGQNPRQLVENAGNPGFSPDGKQLVYERAGSIWLLELATLKNQQLITPGEQPAWSPDGKKIAYADNGIMLWDIAKGEVTPLLPKGLNPAWSANGKKIFFNTLSFSTLYFNLFSYDISSQKTTKIMDNAIQPAASGDGAYLLCSSSGIWIIPLQGGKGIRLTVYGYNPAYSPDSGKIIFSFDANIWVMQSPYPAGKG